MIRVMGENGKSGGEMRGDEIPKRSCGEGHVHECAVYGVVGLASYGIRFDSSCQGFQRFKKH